MPLIAKSTYQPPFYLFNGHLQTIVPSLWRTVPDGVRPAALSRAAWVQVFSHPALELLQNPAISEVVVTDTLPISEDKRFDKLTVLSIAPLIARAVREVFDDGSVTSLFNGNV